MTEISYLDGRRVSVATGHGLFVCDATDINRYHYGIWNDSVVCFIPPIKDDDTFDDGVPVAHYEESYSDKSGTFYDDCAVCGEPTNGSRYCGPSCELYDITNGEMECDA